MAPLAFEQAHRRNGLALRRHAKTSAVRRDHARLKPTSCGPKAALSLTETPCTELTWFRHERRAPAGLLASRFNASCAAFPGTFPVAATLSGRCCACARRYSCRDSPVSGLAALAAFPWSPLGHRRAISESQYTDSPREIFHRMAFRSIAGPEPGPKRFPPGAHRRPNVLRGNDA